MLSTTLNFFIGISLMALGFYRIKKVYRKCREKNDKDYRSKTVSIIVSLIDALSESIFPWTLDWLAMVAIILGSFLTIGPWVLMLNATLHAQ